MTPGHDPRGERSRSERLREELRAYAIAVLYLYVCLGALLLFKTALLREEGLGTLPIGLAAAKALILGKFVLIGESARLGARREARTLLHLIVRRTLAFLLLLAALSVLEEFVVGWAHGRSFAETLAGYEGRSALEILATCLLMLLVLVPFIAVGEVGRALGPGALRRLLLAPVEPPAPPGEPDAS
jgi:hypothetical protein